MTERNVLAFEDSLGDGVQFIAKDDGLHVHCHNDYCGDSESGFGAEVGFDLNLQQVNKLIEFLKRAYTC